MEDADGRISLLEGFMVTIGREIEETLSYVS
jgi:hypothetical protein